MQAMPDPAVNAGITRAVGAARQRCPVYFMTNALAHLQ
jgi:hypothetical protein